MLYVGPDMGSQSTQYDLIWCMVVGQRCTLVKSQLQLKRLQNPYKLSANQCMFGFGTTLSLTIFGLVGSAFSPPLLIALEIWFNQLGSVGHHSSHCNDSKGEVDNLAPEGLTTHS